MLEEALAGGILAEAVGEARHGIEPAPVDGERAHPVERRGLPIDGAGGRSGGAPGQLVLADLVGGQRGGPRVPAEEGGEMGGPATGGALGSELPDLIVLEVGGAEIAQGRPLGAERARERCASRGGHRGWLSSRSCAGAWAGSLSLVAAASRRRPSTFALVGATGKGNVRRRRDGDGTRGVHRDCAGDTAPPPGRLGRHRQGTGDGCSRIFVGRPGDGSPPKRRGGSVLEGLRGEERLAGVVAERGGNPKVYDRWRTACAEAGKP